MFTKFYNLWRQALPKYSSANDGYIPYFGDQDNFVLKWAKIISDSPSATSCLSTKSDFLEGYGFSDGELEKRIVNPKGETFFQIHQKTCREFAQNEGFFWLIRYNALGQATEWEVLPLENCRLGKPDDSGYIGKIHYNPFFGTDHYKKEKTTVYDAFNPKAVKKQLAEQGSSYKGQVLFVGNSSTISRFYPINEAHAASKWMKIEAGVSDYHEDNITNGFLQPYILVMKGDPDSPSLNPDYANFNDTEPATVAQEFDDVMSKNFMGAKRVGNVMVQWVNNPDEKPEVLQLPSNGTGDMFLTLDNQATKKITIAWKVPGILANIQEGVSLGGDANQIRVAVKLMQQRSVKPQRILTDAYSKVLGIFASPHVEELTIVAYNPYPELEILDDKIWNALTVEEKRKWIQDNTEIDLAESEPLPETNPATAARFSNAVPIGFPQKVIDNVTTALSYIDKMGLKCGGKSGKDVSNTIIANAPMGLKQVRRIYNFLKARSEYADMPYDKNCEIVLYNAWGGKQMFDFLEVKLKDLDVWLN